MAVTPRSMTRDDYQPVDQYNYPHYHVKHLLWALWWTIRSRGIQPGQLAPDWDLPSTAGDRVRLSALRGQPVVVRFGSFT